MRISIGSDFSRPVHSCLALAIHIYLQGITCLLFVVEFLAAIVRYLTIFHTSLLDSIGESPAMLVIRSLTIIFTAIGIWIDQNFGPPNGFTYQVFAESDATR